MITPAARRLPTVVFRALIAAAALTGLVIECAYGSMPVVLSFFTIWTNILVAVVFALSAVRVHRGEPDVGPLWRGGVLLFILVTGLVFHLVLANPSSPFNVVEELDELSGAKAVANQLLHTVTPVCAVLDFLFLTAPRTLRPRHAAQWLAYPLAYVVFALVRGALLDPGAPARYTYPFIDVAQYGYARVALNALVLGIGFYALGLALVAADRHRPPRENRISSPAEGPLK
ncbi:MULTISPECIES: Pr6Pr family membrane protein [unclassified Streptomyces]|uniref:Pr6Pr family membrane protein n=1 Tax=unclassified Streptomyces TaxID=2593676 RepID=UPI000DC78E97|nr:MULTISPECIES: Pr6Pr family membrane protein [unclassified Streptomyces]AWZ04334.1 integral membrane regulator [Streptomyces sp. ICC4]AWZ11971.1 integral membrane regulator [Streptomyces sp. ICC1]